MYGRELKKYPVMNALQEKSLFVATLYKSGRFSNLPRTGNNNFNEGAKYGYIHSNGITKLGFISNITERT